MKVKVIAVTIVLTLGVVSAQAGEIAGTRVKGDVQLNCAAQGVEIDAKNQVWSFCIEPLVPTPAYDVVQPYGFKPSPNEAPFPYKVLTLETNTTPVPTVDTATVITDTATAIIDTATVTIDSATVTSTTDKADVVATIQALLSKVFALLALLGIKG